MAMNIGKIQLALVVDTQKLGSDLERSKRTIEQFGSDIPPRFKKVEDALSKLVKEGAITEEQFKRLQTAVGNNRALDAAGRALHQYAKDARLTTSAVRDLEKAMGLSGRNNMAERFRSANTQASALHKTLAQVRMAVGGYFGFNALSDVASTSVDLQSMQKTFYALTGSMEGARAEIRYLQDESQRLGLDFFALTDSFKGFMAAGKTANMPADQVREIFTSVTEASTVLGLNSERTKLALYALEQMLSKGAVSMEELRRQLGDQLPGAFQIGAKAMNMTTQEFAKLVETGKLASAEFLPKFARGLKDAFGNGLAEAMKTPRAEIQRLRNELNFAKLEIGEGGFLAGLSGGAKELAESLRSTELRQSLRSLGEDLGTVTGLLAKTGAVAIEHSSAIMALGVGYATVSKVSRTLGPALEGLAGKVFYLTKAELALAEAQGKSTASARALASARPLLGAGIKAAARGLLGFFGGPWGLAMTAAAASVYAIATAETEAEKVAKRYGTTLKEVSEYYNNLRIAAGDAAGETKRLTDEQIKALELRRDELVGLVQKARQELILNQNATQTVYAGQGVSYKVKLDFSSNEVRDLQKQFKDFVDVVDSGGEVTGDMELGVANLVAEAKKLAREDGGMSEKAREAILLADHIERMLPVVKSLAASFSELGKTKISIDTDRIPDLDDISTRGLTHLLQARQAVFDAINKGYGKTHEGKVDAARAAKKAADDALAEVKVLGSSTGMLARAQANVNKANKDLADALKSGGGGSVDKAAAAIRQVNDEIARLTMTAKEYEALQFERKLADLAAQRVPTERLQKLREAYSSAEIKKQFDEASLAMQGFEKEYQQAMGGMANLSASVAAEMDKFRDAAAVAFEQGAMGAEEYAKALERIDRLQREKLLESSTRWQDGTIRGFRNVASDLGNMAKNMEGTVTGTFNAMGSAFELTTEGMKFNWQNAMNSILNNAFQMLAVNPLLSGLSSIGGNLFSGLIGGGGGGFNVGGERGTSTGTGGGFNMGDGRVSGMHSGGVVGVDSTFTRAVPAALFADAPRFHKGGPILRPDEVPIIAQYGERVLSRSEAAAYGRGIQMNVQIHNNAPGVEVTTSQSVDASGMPSLEIMIDSVDQGLARRYQAGRSQFGQAITRRNNLNPAASLYNK